VSAAVKAHLRDSNEAMEIVWPIPPCGADRRAHPQAGRPGGAGSPTPATGVASPKDLT
jgi:hypothetical protein